MYKKYLNLYNLLIIGICSLTLGILTLTLNRRFLFLIIYLIATILVLLSGANLIKIFTKKYKNNKKNGIILQTSIQLIVSLIFIFIPNIPLSIISLIFGIYMIFNSIVKLVNYIIFKRSKTEGRFVELFLFIFYLIFGLSCILFPLIRIDTIILIIGIYFILLGATYILDFIKQIIPVKQKIKLKRKIKITLPVFLNVLIPHSILMQINKSLNTNEKQNKNFDKNEESDLEIFIHVTKEGFGATGHADLYFDNNIISYGNYDRKTIKLFEAIGDGVLFTTENKEKYIKFCIENSKKTIFEFGIKLTNKQKEAIRKQIDKIKENTYEWNYPITESKKKATKKDSYAIKLNRKVKARFYKFKKGKFKTYFVLSTNCVQLVDYILGSTGSDILKINGIITPGTYYDFLATEYMKKNSNVISYKIYK